MRAIYQTLLVMAYLYVEVGTMYVVIKYFVQHAIMGKSSCFMCENLQEDFLAGIKEGAKQAVKHQFGWGYYFYRWFTRRG